MPVLSTTQLSLAEAMILNQKAQAIAPMQKQLARLQQHVADTQTELALLENDLLAKRNPPVPVPANATLALVANKDGTTSLTVSQ